MNRALINVAALSAILCAGGFYFSAPYIASQIESAAQSNDYAALFSYLDVPSLRESFRGEVAASMAAKDEKLPTPHKFGYMGDVMLTGVAANATDKMFVPTALTDWIAHGGSASPGDIASFSEKYRDINTYGIEVTAKHSTAIITLILERRNLFQWKVERIEIKEIEPEVQKAEPATAVSQRQIQPDQSGPATSAISGASILGPNYDPMVDELSHENVSRCYGSWAGKDQIIDIRYLAGVIHLKMYRGAPSSGNYRPLEATLNEPGDSNPNENNGTINPTEVGAVWGNVDSLEMHCQDLVADADRVPATKISLRNFQKLSAPYERIAAQHAK